MEMEYNILVKKSTVCSLQVSHTGKIPTNSSVATYRVLITVSYNFPPSSGFLVKYNWRKHRSRYYFFKAFSPVRFIQCLVFPPFVTLSSSSSNKIARHFFGLTNMARFCFLRILGRFWTQTLERKCCSTSSNNVGSVWPSL